MMTGKGMMDFYNGDKYTGEFLNSSITGYGCYLTHEGTKLIGYFDDGVCNKHGKKIYPDGTTYLGEFNKDIQHGKGVLTLKNGKQYKGIWNDGKLVQELIQNLVTYENSAALAQYTHIKDTQQKTEEEIKQRMKECAIDQDLLVNFIEIDEEQLTLPKTMQGFGKSDLFIFHLCPKNFLIQQLTNFQTINLTFMISIIFVGLNIEDSYVASTDMESVVFSTVSLSNPLQAIGKMTFAIIMECSIQQDLCRQLQYSSTRDAKGKLQIEV